MQFAKRIFLFIAVNILVVTTITIVTQLLGIQPYLTANGLNYQSLMAICLLWGFGGAFISLGLSRIMAKWMMGVKVLSPHDNNPAYRSLVQRVHQLSEHAGLPAMPEVGIYESSDLNAFATGPTKSRSLVAVSTGLLEQMDKAEVDGVLAHEVAHIANGDMVTMTLVQGVVNAFVMFFARIAGFAVGNMVDEEKRPMVRFITTIIAEIAFSILGMIVVAKFSRAREYRADAGAAKLSSPHNMIRALEKLKMNMHGRGQRNEEGNDQAALASLKISGRPNRFASLFSTHPDLNDRIERLRSGSL